ncbi:CLUMA_CG018842, isoform A [Clunio marinus]|uniref:CLUMA_CG018842, isoform A n=1 Tax=Clunio marinus TaxID=568069 RepID=A0A1J1J0F6_9DIPT|nr:CLUMA_CG018842, isoform A [Clunio marinus]
MYVIFPADEIILLSYGAAQHTRFQPRPTLDNLREPVVPSTGIRPSITSHLDYYSNNNSIERRDTNHLHSSITSQTSIKRDPSPNVSFADDFMNKSRTGVVEENAFRADDTLSSANNTLDRQKKNKFKSRISKISLGKLGRPSSNEQTEPASSRLREDLEIKVTNPTFTHDNLRQKNFDAFFASGEPVYSLERKEKQLSDASLLPLTPNSFATTIDTPSSFGPYPTTPSSFASSPLTPSSISSEKPTRKGSISSLFPPKSPSRLSPSPTNTSSRRPKSAELYRSTEGSVKEPTKSNRRIFAWRGFSPSPSRKMAASSSGGALKDLVHPSLNETLKTQNSVTFKLVKTVSDFTESLAQLYEKHAEELQVLVSNYRKKNGELRKERPPCQSSLFHAWETFLQEVEVDSQSTSEMSNLLSKQVSRPLLERSFHRKVQSRKVFTHRESFETIIAKTEEKLSKCRIDYKQCFTAHRQNPTQHSLTQYIDSHNAYVQQLHATNAMLEAYNCETVPQLLQELEEIYNDLCTIVAEAIVLGAEAISTRAIEQSKRYDGLAINSKSISGQQDLNNFARNTPISASLLRVPKKIFAPPHPPPGEGEDSLEYNDNLPPTFKNELIIEREASLQLRPSLEALRREAQDLDAQIRQLQDSIDALVRNQQRGLDSSLYNKANELQEDISMKKFDLRAKQIHLSAVRAQKELFLSKFEPGSPNPGERKMSTSSSSSMKTKWLKAFRSLKPAGSGASGNEKKNGNATANSQIRIDSEHNLQEYTYKKITPCDVCSQVLRGHTRQGLRCRICKVNAHADCASQLPKCQVKAKLLRRQKSTSEIENRIEQEEEKPNDLDTIYKVLKKAGEISAATEKNQASGGASQPAMDIPIVNIPDYPDRTPRRGPLTFKGPLTHQQKQGLTAPSAADVSSSDEMTSRPFGQPLALRVGSDEDDAPVRDSFARGARRKK